MAEPGRDELVLEAGEARIVVLPHEGGRLASVSVGGVELLVGRDPQGPVYWGSYPMAPWAGRIRHGRFTFDGAEHRLPLRSPPHALHGTVLDEPWEVLGPQEIGIELAPPWPFRGRVRQWFTLAEHGLEIEMTLEADEPMPATIGWHPWFRRVLVAGTEPVSLDFDAAEMLVRDAEGIPTGERVAPPAPPWDDAFIGLRSGPVLEWPGLLRLALSSSCRWWVVYTMPEHAVCVEPQSGPPDAVNQAPEVVEPGVPLVHTMRWSWTRP
jgi:galactose mutarotase-like enzyme